MNELNINIDLKTCIKCGHCVEVCPMRILVQDSETKVISTRNIEGCIACGHCAAICPTDALHHSAFPAETLHPVRLENLPSADAIELLIRYRRSNRAFSSKEIPLPYLIRIMEAAHRAPTGSNVQSVEFTLVRSADKIREIADYTASVFEEGINAIKEMAAKNGLKEDDPKIAQTMARIGRLIGSYRKGYDGIMRNATAAIFIHAPHSCRTGDKDCNLAYQNASLMAEAMGISQFYTGFVCAAYGQDKSKGLNKILDTDNYIYAGIALGIPKYRFKKYMDKQPLRFNEI